MIYWIVCILGLFGVDAFDIDLDAEVEGDSGHIPTPIAHLLRFVNAADVPLMVVLSFLSLFMWIFSMMANYYFNTGLDNTLILAFFAGSLIAGILLTKAVTAPLVPLFRKMKELEKAEPAIGGTAIVISKEVDSSYGQCEQQRKDGAPAILNCRISSETPLPRGTEVAVISYDKDRGTYLVKAL